ncbi:MAG TPA: polysaccharide deacetylase family protein [Candidatus Paenibacillus intestinavium]|nr:polysaccharide deacetylase family protein [Candidatus Paenibacillus intestinavium]
MSLAESLGYSKEDRLLIINGDDYGLNYSVNAAVQQLLVNGSISSATLMMPCAWAREAALWSAAHPQYDVGVHFTFTSEWDNYKWGPVTRHSDVSSLVTNEGYFHNNCKHFEQSASPSQVSLELSSQVEMAINLGVKPTHADSHMGSLYGLETGRHFLLETLDVCAYYGLPFRLPRYVNPLQQHVVSQQYIDSINMLANVADQKGVIVLDYLVGLPFELGQDETTDSFADSLKEFVTQLEPGVTELIIHPSKPSLELDMFHLQPQKRVIEWEAMQQADWQQHLQEHQIKLIYWHQLQELQRSSTLRSYPF